MIKRRIAVLTGCCAGMLIGLGTGCRPRLQPDEEAVLYYFRAAPIHGKVRRVWPQGQAYVDEVLAARARLQEEIEGLEACESARSLWLSQDPRWRAAKTLSDRVGELAEIIDGGRPAREQSLRGPGWIRTDRPLSARSGRHSELSLQPSGLLPSRIPPGPTCGSAGRCKPAPMTWTLMRRA